MAQFIVTGVRVLVFLCYSYIFVVFQLSLKPARICNSSDLSVVFGYPLFALPVLALRKIARAMVSSRRWRMPTTVGALRYVFRCSTCCYRSRTIDKSA